MRQPRGKLDQLQGFFHIENSLQPNLAEFTKSDADDYRTIMLEEAEVSGLKLIFWHFHPCGLGILLHKSNPTIAPNQPTDFVKRLKQRITVAYNRQHQHHGGIWRDRAKLFFIPDTSKDRIEVAAYIMARPKIECGTSVLNWPSTIEETRLGQPYARHALRDLFGEQRFNNSQVERLLAARLEVLGNYAKSYQQIGRGRRPQWRPECEQGENANAQAKPHQPQEYLDNRKRAKQHFFEMLARYQAFCQENGYDRIPRGYSGESELRAWAARRRGEFHYGRMPEWQREALAGTTVLEPLQPVNGPTLPSTAWMRQYRALQNFHRKHGHARVKRRDQNNQTLANWVWIQRAEARKENLHPDKCELLEQVNFIWEPRRINSD